MMVVGSSAAFGCIYIPCMIIRDALTNTCCYVFNVEYVVMCNLLYVPY